MLNSQKFWLKHFIYIYIYIYNAHTYVYAGASPRSFYWGREDGFRPGGRIQVSQNHLFPNAAFSSDFVHLIFERYENLKFLVSVRKKISLKIAISGGRPPGSEPGDAIPHSPPPATLVATLMYICKLEDDDG